MASYPVEQLVGHARLPEKRRPTGFLQVLNMRVNGYRENRVTPALSNVASHGKPRLIEQICCVHPDAAEFHRFEV